MSGIFLSYRRDDASGWTGRLYEHMIREWGSDQVFMDIDAIAPGDDFRDAIARTMDVCDIVMVVIGPNWLTARDHAGNRRLDNEGDTHRAEVAAALVSDVRVVPVLVGGAAMPSESDLPEPLKDLAYRNAAVIEDRRFASDVGALQKVLRQLVDSAASTRSTPGGPGHTSNAGDGHGAAVPLQTETAGRDTVAGSTATSTRRAGLATLPTMLAGAGLLMTLVWGLMPRAWHNELAGTRIGAVILLAALQALELPALLGVGIGLWSKQWRWTFAAGIAGLLILGIWLLQLVSTHADEVGDLISPARDGVPNALTFAGVLLVLVAGSLGMRHTSTRQ